MNHSFCIIPLSAKSESYGDYGTLMLDGYKLVAALLVMGKFFMSN